MPVAEEEMVRVSVHNPAAMELFSTKRQRQAERNERRCWREAELVEVRSLVEEHSKSIGEQEARIVELYNGGLQLKLISKQIGCSYEKIVKTLERLNVPKRNLGNFWTKAKIPTPEEADAIRLQIQSEWTEEERMRHATGEILVTDVL